MSEILKNPVVTGVGGGIAGLLVGSLLSLSTIESKVGSSMGRAMEDLSAAVQGDDAALSGVSERLAALEASVSGNAEAVAGLGTQVAGDLGERIAGLEARIDAVAEDIGSQISQTAEAQAEAVRGALGAQPAAARQPEAATGAVSAPPVATPPGLSMRAEARRVGETFVLADGAVRAFVQRVDAEAGTALLSVNGAAAQLSPGEAITVRHDAGACRLALSEVGADGVRISSDCDMPAGDGAAYGPGEMASLGDGQLRVFVSGILGDAARLAINGLDTQSLRVGESHSVEDCTVSVTGIRGNRVLLDGGCS
ncbi:MAG: hypothetical protein RID11_16790 [Roseovarius sp.]|jgi:hypothetical protein|uniref:hypothetical protein n=1 Tax=Roseovarius sp. TaxID=1486281 RepID=UPI0032EBFACE